MRMDRSFFPYSLSNGLLADLKEDKFPSQISAWSHKPLTLAQGATHYGYVFDGLTSLTCAAGRFELSPGMYFSVPGDVLLEGNSRGFAVSRSGYRGFFQIGGPIEPSGRLQYIDGCTDSLLVPPVMLGDPCLNLLYFPPGIEQTQHTHPSMRAGIVARGHGLCITPEENIPLFPGQIFLIPADRLHSFSTKRSSMTVIAYHPDSDYGPTHENHPMINRTLVNGRSASELMHIRTKQDHHDDLVLLDQHVVTN